MKFLSGGPGGNWIDPDPVGELGELRSSQVVEHKSRLDRFIRGVLQAENLVVLTGLGTSRCVRDEHGKSPAPTMLDLWNEAVQQLGSEFEAVKEKVRYPSDSAGQDVELLLSHCQLFQSLNPDDQVDAFIAAIEKLIVERCSFVGDGVDLSIHETFLRKVARRSTRQPRMKLFTTNYDLCFETAASRIHFVVVDGFSHTEPQEFDGSYFSYDLVRREQDREAPDYIPNVFHLYKMHGSLDWQSRGHQIIKGSQPNKPRIIYPRHTKFQASYEQPFIEMMSRFQLALRQPNTGLLIIGSGLGDSHIAQPVMSAIRSNVSLVAAVVAPDVDTPSNPTIDSITSLIRGGDPRLMLLAARFEDLVSMLPDLVAATEEEEHWQRLRGIGGHQ